MGTKVCTLASANRPLSCSINRSTRVPAAGSVVLDQPVLEFGIHSQMNSG
jgi:hypothetical protein